MIDRKIKYTDLNVGSRLKFVVTVICEVLY